MDLDDTIGCELGYIHWRRSTVYLVLFRVVILDMNRLCIRAVLHTSASTPRVLGDLGDRTRDCHHLRGIGRYPIGLHPQTASSSSSQQQGPWRIKPNHPSAFSSINLQSLISPRRILQGGLLLSQVQTGSFNSSFVSETHLVLEEYRNGRGAEPRSPHSPNYLLTHSGIGLSTAHLLASYLPTLLILAVRNLKTGEEAATAISKANPDVKVEVWRLDMADFGSVKEFAGMVGALNRLDVFVSVGNWGFFVSFFGSESYETWLEVPLHDTYRYIIVWHPPPLPGCQRRYLTLQIQQDGGWSRINVSDENPLPTDRNRNLSKLFYASPPSVFKLIPSRPLFYPSLSSQSCNTP